MNTTHRAPRRVVYLPVLPPEVWLNILRYATWVPFLLDPKTALQLSLSAKREQKRLYRQSLVTKRYLVRVCKQWNVWGAPYLYESIYLGRGRSIRALRDALNRSRHSGETCPYGWWTKRLDLAMRDMTTGAVPVTYICDMIECFPNLSIVNFAITAPRFTNFPEEAYIAIVLSLTRWSAPSLEALVWEGSLFSRAYDVWYAFLKDAVNLRTLRFPDMLEDGDQQIPHLPLLSLESLYTHNGLVKGDLPSLRHLVADIVPPAKWTSLLEIHGAKLEVVRLDFDFYTVVISSFLALLSASCPKLVRLEVSAISWQLLETPEGSQYELAGL
ncbi:hypothetical protein FPV67DRAFT_883111 [Lyophyllum atratum]|nr:hypothetical protein FPV67DRAFT_883111 [Lyophyllum atratum]